MLQASPNSQVYTDLLCASIERNADRSCMCIKRNGTYSSWTYREFHRDINRVASALKAHGFTDATNIMVIGENTPEWVIAWHAGFLAGGKTVPVDPNLPVSEIREIVSQTQPKFVFCSKGFAALFEEMKAEFSCISFVIVDDEKLKNPAASREASSITKEEENYSRLLSPKQASVNAQTVGFTRAQTTFAAFASKGNPDDDVFSRTFSPNDPAVTIFTSGTTGKAKGVVLCQRNFTAISLSAIPRMHVGPGDTMMAVLPLHHVFGACACLPGALGGGLDIVLIPTVKGSLMMEGLREKHVSMLPAVPKMLQLFYNSIQQNVKSKGIAVRASFACLLFVSFAVGRFLGQKFRARLFASVHKNFGGRLSIIISGGASIRKNIFNGFRLMGFNIVEGYGLSETFGAVTLCPLEKPKLGSVGLPLDANEVRIDNPDASGVGEVCFRGANVFSGYLNNSELTTASFDADGWFHTGDLGRLDKDGFIFISGRIKDIIVLDSGKNVYPDELEEFYAESECMEEIGVFSAMARGKEIAGALIVPSLDIRRNHTIPEATDIVRNEVLRLGRDLPSYKKITDFAVVYDPLPRTTSKKLKKHELREMYYSLKESDHSRKSKPTISAMEALLMSNSEYRIIAGFAAKLSNKSDEVKLPPSLNLELDLGLDSMKKLDLLCMIERRFCFAFSDEDLVKLETLGDVYSAAMDLAPETGSTACEETVADIKQRILGAKLPVPYPARSAAAATTAIPFIARAAGKLLWNVSTAGVIQVPSKKAVIFCANRQSVADPLWIIYSLPQHIRKRTFIVGGRDLLPAPLIASFAGHIIPVKRDGDVALILRTSMAVLADGNNLLVFPESGASKTGELRKFKSGIGLLMLEVNATIVPVRVRGTMETWPIGGLPNLLIGKKGAPTVTFGPEITFQGLISRNRISPYSTADQIAACVRDIISEM